MTKLKVKSLCVSITMFQPRLVPSALIRAILTWVCPPILLNHNLNILEISDLFLISDCFDDPISSCHDIYTHCSHTEPSLLPYSRRHRHRLFRRRMMVKYTNTLSLPLPSSFVERERAIMACELKLSSPEIFDTQAALIQIPLGT